MCISAAVVLAPRFSSAESNGIRCFSQVKELILERNLKLRSGLASTDSSRLQARQEALRPNPVLKFQAENFGGTTDAEQPQYTAGISQQIETGGKREARSLLAAARTESVKAQVKVKNQQLLAQARIAFAEAVAARQLLALARQEVSVSEEALRLIERKTSYGGALALEADKADIALRSARLKLRRQKHEFIEAKIALASLWGGDPSRLDLSKQSLSLHLPEKEINASDMRASPRLSQARAERHLAARASDLERTNSIPDVTVSANYRQFEQDDGHAFVAAVSVPLQLFDRNQFATKSAESALQSSEFDLKDTEIVLGTSLNELKGHLELLIEERELLEEEILPRSRKVLSKATEAYQSGRISYIEYQDAQESYLGRKEQLIEITHSALTTQVEIQQLSGTLSERLKEAEQEECNVS